MFARRQDGRQLGSGTPHANAPFLQYDVGATGNLMDLEAGAQHDRFNSPPFTQEPRTFGTFCSPQIDPTIGLLQAPTPSPPNIEPKSRRVGKGCGRSCSSGGSRSN